MREELRMRRLRPGKSFSTLRKRRRPVAKKKRKKRNMEQSEGKENDKLVLPLSFAKVHETESSKLWGGLTPTHLTDFPPPREPRVSWFSGTKVGWECTWSVSTLKQGKPLVYEFGCQPDENNPRGEILLPRLVNFGKNGSVLNISLFAETVHSFSSSLRVGLPKGNIRVSDWKKRGDEEEEKEEEEEVENFAFTIFQNEFTRINLKSFFPL
ncbi:hypothetical protein RUM44_004343 [Polyplax serrata]|uniref:Uncharacterized protein n=1 Tax=Polyplax serrata TaxID=468196 RepID=A0ABR1B388_POLSC